MAAEKQDAGQLLLEALEKRWKNYRVELKRCRAEFSNEAVHDLRVAVRRLLAVIELLNAISPRPRLQKLPAPLRTSSMNSTICVTHKSCLPNSPK